MDNTVTFEVTAEDMATDRAQRLARNTKTHDVTEGCAVEMAARRALGMYVESGYAAVWVYPDGLHKEAMHRYLVDQQTTDNLLAIDRGEEVEPWTVTATLKE